MSKNFPYWTAIFHKIFSLWHRSGTNFLFFIITNFHKGLPNFPEIPIKSSFLLITQNRNHTTRTYCSTTLTVFCGGNQGDFVWFSGLFRWFFLWYSLCIWRFSDFCYHGVIMEQSAFVSLSMRFQMRLPLKKTHLERIKNALKHINFYNT